MSCLKGWGILYADHSDVTDSTETNVERAVACLKTHFSEVTDVPMEYSCAVMGECCEEECCDE